MELYRQEDLNKYKEEAKAPFFTHPYEDIRDSIAALLERMTDDLIFIDNFQERLQLARSEIINPLNFYGFVTELKVGYFLKNRCQSFEVIKTGSTPTPDFKADGVYIEVNTPNLFYPILNKLEKELKKIDPRFSFKRKYFFKPDNEMKNRLDNDVKALFNELKENLEQYKGKVLDKYPVAILGNKDENRWFGILNDGIEHVPGRNACLRPSQETFKVYIDGSLKSKIEKDGENKLCRNEIGQYILSNGLNEKHPNILWSEFLFLEDFQRALSDEKINWEKRGLPAQLDAQIITICSIDRCYTCAKNKIILLNGKTEEQYLRQVREFIEKLYPNEKQIILSETAEELDILNCKINSNK